MAWKHAFNAVFFENKLLLDQIATMIKKFNFLIFILLITSCQERSVSDKLHYQPVLDSLQISFQEKLDTGEGMLQASREYRLQTDSLLSVVYSQILDVQDLNLDSLKLTQKKFLLKKQTKEDSIWKEVDAVFSETGITPQLERMAAYEFIGDMNLKRASQLNRILIKNGGYRVTGKQLKQK
ncbi:hypothetical protein [Gramella sp. KN1008]|uniref:hypothetical protein n=1 Tax=Gramella sp. KN1008 TaxID=2529298 RepID=UPI00103CCDD2|nr:hypothetical protein [Gramella sp. KN1008]TBW29968.1 hypothetical protein EZJ28_00760 [Gramella sp. KN1008]